MAYKGERSESSFQPHPVGRFNGVIYSFRDFGEKENQFGNVERRCYFGIESFDEFQEVGRTYAGFVFFNMKWGNPEATGKMRPIMQQLREVLLDRKITDEKEWYSFDENDYMGIRVRYRVTHNESQNGKTYAKTELLERLDDQDTGEQYNETTITKDDEVKSDKEDLPF